MVATRAKTRIRGQNITPTSSSIPTQGDGGMGKAKHQKPKPTRKAKQPSHSKKRGGKQNDVSELRSQLDVLGLKIIQVTADGNCFFRALGDQLEGDEDQHDKYRSMVVEYIKNNREMFEPFVEDEVPFDEYCQSMGQDGTWAGHMELQAASLVTHSNICIHRHMSPRWYIRNFNENEARMIHLSYHDGEHYNSVRVKEDTCSGPARPIVIKGDNDVAPKSAGKSRCENGIHVHKEFLKLVKAGSGCEDMAKVEQVLQAIGDVDAAIELLVAEQAMLDQIIAEDEHKDENSEQQSTKVEEQTCEVVEVSKNNGDVAPNKSSHCQSDDKKISRNKACPCGSKKKYKSCCSTAAGKSSARFPVNQTVDYGKSRKERKQGRKGGASVASSIQSDGGPPDMGALCI